MGDYMWQFASRVSHSNLASTFEVESLEPILVFGIYICGAIAANASNVTIKNGTTTIATVPVGILIDHTINIPFIADSGLSFTANANGSAIDVTVFHMAPGE